MGTTLEDAAYELHLEDLHKSYIDSLERFASSKNLGELKNNLEELQGMRASIEDSMSNIKGEELDRLEEALNEISTIDRVYKTLITENKRSQHQFIAGIILAIVGIILSIRSIFL